MKRQQKITQANKIKILYIILAAVVLSIVLTAILSAGIATRTMDGLYNDYEFTIQNLESTISEKDTEIQTINSEKKDLKETLHEIESDREAEFEIVKKYNFVISEAPVDSGITVDLILYMDEQCKRWDIPTTMMWGISFIESNYHVRIENTSSGTRGLGQVMPNANSVKYYWNTVLGHTGALDLDLLYDPYVNIEIMCSIIADDLAHDKSLYETINHYSGGGGQEYYGKLTNYCTKHGFTLTESSCHYNMD